MLSLYLCDWLSRHLAHCACFKLKQRLLSRSYRGSVYIVAFDTFLRCYKHDVFFIFFNSIRYAILFTLCCRMKWFLFSSCKVRIQQSRCGTFTFRCLTTSWPIEKQLKNVPNEFQQSLIKHQIMFFFNNFALNLYFFPMRLLFVCGTRVHCCHLEREKNDRLTMWSQGDRE